MREKLHRTGTHFELGQLTDTIERPNDLGQRSWDKLQKHEPLLDPNQSTARSKPGWGANKRREDCSKWAYCFCGEQDLRGEPPAHVVAQFEEVLGDLIRDEEGKCRLRLAFHPLMRRWCTFHSVKRPDLGESGTLWQVVFIHMDDPKPGYTPNDLGGVARQHLRGLIGDYALPTREDFENLRRFGARHQKLGTHMDRLERLSAGHRLRENDMERQMDDCARGTADYSANAEIDAANQRAGSGWHMRETFIDDKGPGAVAYKADEERFQSIQKNGYRIIMKKSREDRERELRMDARDAEREAQRDALRRGGKREFIAEHEHDATLPAVTKGPNIIVRIPGKVTI